MDDHGVHPCGMHLLFNAAFGCEIGNDAQFKLCLICVLILCDPFFPMKQFDFASIFTQFYLSYNLVEHPMSLLMFRILMYVIKHIFR